MRLTDAAATELVCRRASRLLLAVSRQESAPLQARTRPTRHAARAEPLGPHRRDSPDNPPGNAST